MKTITIRGIDSDIAERLKSKASEQNKSLNQLVLEMIKKNLGVDKEIKYSKEYDDLDELFGNWSEEEFKCIQKKIDGERQIDRDLWE